MLRMVAARHRLTLVGNGIETGLIELRLGNEGISHLLLQCAQAREPQTTQIYADVEVA